MQLSKNSQKVQAYLNNFGLKIKVLELTESTRTAQEAAIAARCEVGQIVKSLVFPQRRGSSDVPGQRQESAGCEKG